MVPLQKFDYLVACRFSHRAIHADRNNSQGGSLPFVVMAHFRHRDIELPSQASLYARQHEPFLLERRPAGQVEVEDPEVPLLINARLAPAADPLSKGDLVVVESHDKDRDVYYVKHLTNIES